MINWKPQSHYHASRFGVDAVVAIECVAFALIAFAAEMMGFL